MYFHYFREFGDNVPEENIRGAVEGAFQLEQALAAFSVPEEDRRNATELYNPFTKEELNARWPVRYFLPPNVS